VRARTGLEHAQKQEARVRQLRAKEISSDSDLQERVYELALARLRVNQAVMEQAQAANEFEQAVERLAQRTVSSPFQGVVAQRFKSVGETVEKFVPVLEVIDLDPLWVEFDCPVADERFFTVGTSVRVAPAVRPDDVRSAVIVYTSVKASPSSHTFMVRAAVDNPHHDWKSGLKMLVTRTTDAAVGAGPPSAGK
jgi:multidrug efflux pump subunit AcrA (membrane-fusion protein)